jgi:hypothetical protein
MFLRNVSIDLQTTRFQDPRLQQQQQHNGNVFSGSGTTSLERPLARPRHRWEDVIRMDLRETGLRGVDWLRLAQDRDQWRTVVNVVMHLWNFVLNATRNLHD